MLLILVLLSVAIAKCPHNCNNHGTCSGNQCICQDGYAGVDCSIPDTALSVNNPINATVRVGKWQYYHFNLMNDGAEATVLMHETNSGVAHDCDLYLQVNSYPTRSSYFSKDTGVGRDATLTINSTAPRGQWFVGVLGFLGCSYTISLSQPSLDCPQGCSGKGTCLDGGICACNVGFGGVSCSQTNRSLTTGSSLSGSVAQRKWDYFYFDVDQVQEEVTFVLNAQHDCDLYLKKDSFPSMFDFDAVNASAPPAPGQADISSLTLQSPMVGRYYLGVFGFEASSYTISATSSVFNNNNCPNNCSGQTHGSCSRGRCQCNAPFSGNACEYDDADLEFGTPVSGFVDVGEWNYFTVTSDSSNTLVILAQQSGGNEADCDLYVKSGGLPNRSSFDYADLGIGSTMWINITNPGQQTWYIGLYGWKTCSFNITVAEVSGGSDCGPHGHSANDACVCDSGYYGPRCDVAPTVLHSGAPTIAGSVANGQWTYYLLQGNGISYTVTVQTNSTAAGIVWVFAQLDDIPTETDNVQSDKAQKNMHVIHLEAPVAEQRTFLIGVFGAAFNRPDSTVLNYKIAAFVF